MTVAVNRNPGGTESSLGKSWCLEEIQLHQSKRRSLLSLLFQKSSCDYDPTSATVKTDRRLKTRTLLVPCRNPLTLDNETGEHTEKMFGGRLILRASGREAMVKVARRWILEPA
jgi:hypothetical protein